MKFKKTQHSDPLSFFDTSYLLEENDDAVEVQIYAHSQNDIEVVVYAEWGKYKNSLNEFSNTKDANIFAAKVMSYYEKNI